MLQPGALEPAIFGCDDGLQGWEIFVHAPVIALQYARFLPVATSGGTSSPDTCRQNEIASCPLGTNIHPCSRIFDDGEVSIGAGATNAVSGIGIAECMHELGPPLPVPTSIQLVEIPLDPGGSIGCTLRYRTLGLAWWKISPPAIQLSLEVVSTSFRSYCENFDIYPMRIFREFMIKPWRKAHSPTSILIPRDRTKLGIRMRKSNPLPLSSRQSTMHPPKAHPCFQTRTIKKERRSTHSSRTRTLCPAAIRSLTA